MSDLTERQAQVLDYIKARIAEGMPPTVMEIAEHFKFRSPNTVQGHLALLKRKGRISRSPGMARGIKVLP